MTFQKDRQPTIFNTLWLQQHPKTIPPQLQMLREDFVQRFPSESLKNITLDQYVMGKPDSFCYWLEFKTKALGSISGGTSAKFGVWWSKSENRWRWNSSYGDEEIALASMKAGILALINATNAQQFEALDAIGNKILGGRRYSLRAKPLYLYFPEYFLPIANPEHLRYFLRQFGEKPKGDLMALNRQLLTFLRLHAQFEGFDTFQMMVYLYENHPPKKEIVSHQEIQYPDISPEEQPDLTEPPGSNRTKVFISYSHENRDDLERLRIHLKAAQLHKWVEVEWWDDTQINPGQDWYDAIKKAIVTTRVAVLLISVDYLASDFILDNELSPLLAASEEEGVTILPVILGPCLFRLTNLARFQAVNNPSNPLSKVNKHEKDEVWTRVIETIVNSDNS
ncbi:hypothetical protein KDW_39680 [Dictyobacter vulcani]|uniref:TIR domain-containing protein n=1 Tax=Dictyobacter vulcani TaxID=2607529 RepID=A0A5J4KX75_9CHLR|nr:toll/interleukin-1 receptor domain-containing protein [Dictyobacter vulcani]GER89806.1 hypothetical protein KDW_39680 [Dictyobacter vulcani]